MRLEIPVPFVSIHCIILNCAATTMSVIEVGSMLSTSFNSISESFSSNEIAAFRAQCENMLDGYVKLCYSYLWGASNLFVDCMKPITIFLREKINYYSYKFCLSPICGLQFKNVFHVFRRRTCRYFMFMSLMLNCSGQFCHPSSKLTHVRCSMKHKGYFKYG